VPNLSEDILAQYDDETDRQIATAAANVEGEHYMQLCLVGELIRICRQMGYERVGVAFCTGLHAEAETLVEMLEEHFRVSSVCCKVCGVDKQQLRMRQVCPDRRETMCNPIAQARLLEQDGCELNVVCGLCIGHDILFTKHSQAPVSTLIVKDRVLAHNPAGALYSGYYRRRSEVWEPKSS